MKKILWQERCPGPASPRFSRLSPPELLILSGSGNHQTTKSKKTLCSVDKPVDAEAELAKEEMDHTATMQRIAQQVISGQSMH